VTAVLKTLQADGLQTAAATHARPESVPQASQWLREHGVQSNAKHSKFHSITHILGINIRAKLSFSSALATS
jgi:hypothetical protein